MERVEKMDARGNKETVEIEQQRYTQAAISLGNSFLQGKTKAEKIKESLERYPEENRKAALKAFLQVVTSTMDLENTPAILEAILLMKDDAETKRACRKAEEIHRSQRRKLQEQKAALEEDRTKVMREKLAAEGIEGSALAGFNIIQLPQWEEISLQIQQEYQKMLRDLQSTLFKTER